MIRRREFITLLGGGAAAGWPVAARAQPEKVPRIGFLKLGLASAYTSWVEALQTGLRERGYVEGRNIVIEFRWAETVDQLPELAADLVRMNVDVIFALASTETEAARQATKTIPIVFGSHADPVGLGHVASLARPGGNLTGLTVVQTDLTTKALELLKEAVPQVTRIALLFNPAAPSHRPTLQALETAGEKLGVQLLRAPVRTVDDFDGAFATMARERVGGFFVSTEAVTVSNRTRLAELALKQQLPGMFGVRDNVEAGGLMSYAPDHHGLVRRAATYIDKILKGAKPADLPVEQASKYYLVINLKTAKAIGLTISESFLLRADELIE
jgi:putative tryptophan/tyrosine transport system substrate-binding protein